VDGLLNLRQRFLLWANRPRISHEYSNMQLPFVNPWLVSFVDGLLNLCQQFLRGLQIGMTQPRKNLDGAAE
jgi:hypothetical protein